MKTKFVYYDKQTGQIKDILSKRKRGRAPYVEVEFERIRGELEAVYRRVTSNRDNVDFVFPNTPNQML